MLMVVFGAGASYDSVSSMPLPLGGDLAQFLFEQTVYRRMPLANQLFLPVQNFAQARAAYPDTAPLFPKLAEGDIEAKLEQLREEHRLNGRRTKQFAALRFYLRDVIWQSENHWGSQLQLQLNHVGLIDDIEMVRGGEDVLLVTFNYDTLIERALAYEWPISQMSDFVASHPYKLIKLHGSTSWGRRITLPTATREAVLKNVYPGALIDCGSKWELQDEYYYGTTSPPDYQTPDLFVPAIAIPTVNKATFECPPEHLEALTARIPDVDRILTVGWRGSEGHFLDLLSKNVSGAPDLLSVSGSTADAVATINNLKGAGMTFGRIEAYGGGFSSFVREAGVRALLKWPK